MGISPADVEGLAVALYEQLGFDPSVPVDTFRLARTLLGPAAIARGTSMVGLPAMLSYVRGAHRISIARKLSYACAAFCVGHELGHVVFHRLNYREEDLETACDALGAALMAPMPAVRAMVRSFGPDHEAIAEEICATQTWAALRVAECLGMPRAVVTLRHVHVRGSEDFQWGDAQQIRRIAASRASRPGLRKTRLSDGSRAIVLDVEEDCAS